MFSPQDSEKARRVAQRKARKSKVTPSQRARRRKPQPKRHAKERYTTDSYCRAVTRACEKAKVDRWTPLRLRHSRATEIRKKYGLEAQLEEEGS